MTAEYPAAGRIFSQPDASPYRLSERRAAGKPPRAEMGVVYPYGKSERSVIVDLTEDELLELAESALAAFRSLRSASREPR